MQNYHDAVGSFPPGELEIAYWADYSSHVYLLLFIDQAPLYNAVNFSIHLDSNPSQGSSPLSVTNATVWETSLRVFMCPSDVDRLTSTHGHNNYVGCSGSAPASCRERGPFNGVFIGATFCRGCTTLLTAAQVFGLRDVSDGTSNTMCFSEKVKGVTDNSVRDQSLPLSSVFDANLSGNKDIPTDYFTSCNNLNTASAPLQTGRGFTNNFEDVPFCGIGCYWYSGMPPQTRFTSIMTPNTWSCSYKSNGIGNNDNGAHTASSRHPGGVNVLLCDSSVKFIKDSISPQTWWAIGTKSNGEVVSSDSY